jgi:hypothetical protein
VVTKLELAMGKGFCNTNKASGFEVRITKDGMAKWWPVHGRKD